MTSVYTHNPTMQMIGHQSPYRASGYEDGGFHKIMDQIADIYRAYTDQMKEEKKTSYSMFRPSLDIFLLGMIYGIRTERRERRESVKA